VESFARARRVSLSEKKGMAFDRDVLGAKKTCGTSGLLFDFEPLTASAADSLRYTDRESGGKLWNERM
jgi:hypothetical protein